MSIKDGIVLQRGKAFGTGEESNAQVHNRKPNLALMSLPPRPPIAAFARAHMHTCIHDLNWLAILGVKHES